MINLYMINAKGWVTSIALTYGDDGAHTEELFQLEKCGSRFSCWVSTLGNMFEYIAVCDHKSIKIYSSNDGTELGSVDLTVEFELSLRNFN